MKVNEITSGTFRFGSFKFYISTPIFYNGLPEDSEYFCVLVREVFKSVNMEWISPVDPIRDERFLIFKHIGTLEKTLQDDDLIAYNHYVMRKQIADHPIKLSRYAILDLINICKKAKKRAGP